MNDIANQDMTGAAEPAAERITVALVKQCSLVKKITGFSVDVSVYRPTPGEAQPTTEAIVEVVLDSEEPDDPATVPQGIEQIRATHFLICDVTCPESRKVTIDTLLNRLKADLKKKVCEDRTLGGLALDTVFKAALIEETSATAHSGRITLAVETTYRTLEDDPYELFNNPA
jgi:hypothetical protein